MFSKTNVTLETCTRELATTFAQMPGLDGERILKPARLTFLRQHLKVGTFASPSWAVTVDKETGNRYRVNGHHSSTVLAELTVDEFPKDLLVTIEEYTTDNLSTDAFLIFNLFDHPASARGNLDVMNLYRVHYPDLAHISTGLVLHMASGIALHEKSLLEKGASGLFLPTRNRGQYLERPESRQFIVWAAQFADAVHGWMLKKPGIVAEMVAEWRMDAQVADAFWRLVFEESHPDADHETRELSRNLKDLVGKAIKVSQDRFRKETAKQWKRFRRGAAASAEPPSVIYDEPASAAPLDASA